MKKYSEVVRSAQDALGYQKIIPSDVVRILADAGLVEDDRAPVEPAPGPTLHDIAEKTIEMMMSLPGARGENRTAMRNLITSAVLEARARGIKEAEETARADINKACEILHHTLGGYEYEEETLEGLAQCVREALHSTTQARNEALDEAAQARSKVRETEARRDAARAERDEALRARDAATRDRELMRVKLEDAKLERDRIASHALAGHVIGFSVTGIGTYEIKVMLDNGHITASSVGRPVSIAFTDES